MIKREILIKVCLNKKLDIEECNDELEKKGYDKLNSGERYLFLERDTKEKEEEHEKYQKQHPDTHQFEHDKKKREELKKEGLSAWRFPLSKKVNLTLPPKLFDAVRKREKNISRHIAYLLAKDIKEHEEEEKKLK